MKNLRIAAAALSAAALVSAGCFLISGQFVVSFVFPSPLDLSNGVLAGVPVDLNLVSAYQNHKHDLEDVNDLALVGRITNKGSAATSVEMWMVANPGTPLTTATAVRSQGTRIWGPLPIAAGATRNVDWGVSAPLFKNRPALVSEIKGDGRFDLYLIGASDPFSLRIENGALIAVITAGR